MACTQKCFVCDRVQGIVTREESCVNKRLQWRGNLFQ
jgi:hypothetical protein